MIDEIGMELEGVVVVSDTMKIQELSKMPYLLFVQAGRLPLLCFNEK